MKALLAKCPVCDSIMAWLAGSMVARSSARPVVWMAAVARCCHPRLANGSSMGLGTGCWTGCVRSDHAGGCQPAVRNALAASIAAWIARGVWPADWKVWRIAAVSSGS